MQSEMALKATMKPRLIVNEPRSRKVRTLRTPLGRFGYTRDKGEGDMFGTQTLETRLRAIVRDEGDRVIDEYDLGSGLVTNVGVLALAYDTAYGGAGSELAGLATGKPQGKAKTAFNLFSQLAWHQWGTSETSATTYDLALNAAAKTKTNAATEATEAKNTVTTSGAGKPKLVSTVTLEAGETLKITEWGIFTQKVLSATTGTPLTAVSATTGTVTGTPLTASGEEAQGERLKVLLAAKNAKKEAKKIWGLIVHNTTSVVTVPAWYKYGEAETGGTEEPESTSAYELLPVMFDHRVFGVITVESGNKIEFPWELEIQSGH